MERKLLMPSTCLNGGSGRSAMAEINKGWRFSICDGASDVVCSN